MPSKLSFLKTLPVKKKIGGRCLSVKEDDDNDLYKEKEVGGNVLSIEEDLDGNDLFAKEKTYTLDIHKAREANPFTAKQIVKSESPLDRDGLGLWSRPTKEKTWAKPSLIKKKDKW